MSEERFAIEVLTPRQAEVVALLAQGVTSNRELAERLVVTEHTVHAHIASVLWKFGLSSRSQIVAYALTHGRVVDNLWEPDNA